LMVRRFMTWLRVAMRFLIMFPPSTKNRAGSFSQWPIESFRGKKAQGPRPYERQDEDESISHFIFLSLPLYARIVPGHFLPGRDKAPRFGPLMSSDLFRYFP
jgi:hypothetical protein